MNQFKTNEFKCPVCNSDFGENARKTTTRNWCKTYTSIFGSSYGTAPCEIKCPRCNTKFLYCRQDKEHYYIEILEAKV